MSGGLIGIAGRDARVTFNTRLPIPRVCLVADLFTIYFHLFYSFLFYIPINKVPVLILDVTHLAKGHGNDACNKPPPPWTFSKKKKKNHHPSALGNQCVSAGKSLKQKHACRHGCGLLGVLRTSGSHGYSTAVAAHMLLVLPHGAYNYIVMCLRQWFPILPWNHGTLVWIQTGLGTSFLHVRM